MAHHVMQILSPFHSSGHVPTSHPHSAFTPIHSVINWSTTHAVGFQYLYMISWTPTGYVATSMYDKVDGSLSTVGGNLYAAPQLGLAPGSQPLSTKPLRSGLRMLNVNPSLTIEGTCYALPVSDPLPITFAADSGSDPWVNITHTNFNNLVSYITTNPKVKVILAKDVHKHTFVNVPLSETAYEKFYQFNQENIPDNANNVTWQNAYTSIQYDMPMTQWVLYFPTTSSAQNYSVNAVRTDGCRYPTTTALNSAGSVPPKISSDQHKSMISGAKGVVMDPTKGTAHKGWVGRVVEEAEAGLERLGQGAVHAGEWLIGQGLSKLAGRAASWIGSEVGSIASTAAPLMIAGVP